MIFPNFFSLNCSLFDRSQPFCSGALINPQVIITAAHCTENEIAGVKIGTRNWLLDDIYGRDYYARQISKVIVHPDFKKNLDRVYADMLGDVALMVLNKPLPANYTTLKLGTSSTKIPDLLTTVGYGTTSEGGGVMSPVMRVVNLTLVERKQCNTLLNRVVSFSTKKNLFCWGGGGGIKRGGTFHLILVCTIAYLLLRSH